MTYQPIIGLEVHVELKTKSKLFCGCPAEHFGTKPNTQTCPVCLGLPGALPVPNKKAVDWTILLGLALNCSIHKVSRFDRKNYFYPDLPKGYQISQYDEPLASKGFVKIDTKKIRIRRVHLEEDAGKLLHEEVNGVKSTLVDFNRSGVALVEIVTEPDVRSSEEARTFLKKMRQIARYLGISDGDMEKGTMRLEPNISVKLETRNTKHEDDLPPYKVEIKNINSFNFAKKAIDFEIARQVSLLEKGETPLQETRGWDEKKGVTVSQRGKGEAHDYRYFPEPDIPPMEFSKSQIENLRSQIPELAEEKIARFIREYNLSQYDAEILCDSRERAEYYESTIRELKNLRIKELTEKTVANWIINKKVDTSKVAPEDLVKMIAATTQTTSMPDEELEKIIKEVISKNPKAVADYQGGKEQALMFLIGQVMRETKGKRGFDKMKTVIEQRLNA